MCRGRYQIIQFITSNEGKYNEVAAALGKRGFELQWRKFPYPEVQSSSLDEVVTEGLKWIVSRMENPQAFIIDDSGLFIPALKDFPGVFSAYTLKTIGNQGILTLMEKQKNREARFEARVGYYSESTGPKVFPGVCKGTIARMPAGTGGFGYDPIFIPDGYDTTFAQMDAAQKNEFSHRGKAIAGLLEFLG